MHAMHAINQIRGGGAPITTASEGPPVFPNHHSSQVKQLTCQRTAPSIAAPTQPRWCCHWIVKVEGSRG